MDTSHLEGVVTAYRQSSVLDTDGCLKLDGLPFRAGDSVEVIIFFNARKPDDWEEFPFRGAAYRYDRPTDPLFDDCVASEK